MTQVPNYSRVSEQNSNPFVRHMYKTAYMPDVRAFCAIKAYSERMDSYLCDFGFGGVWTKASELTRFVL